MSTLIIPCAGRSTLMGKPKCAVRHPNGQLLIKRSISGFGINRFDRIIITILDSDEKEFHISKLIDEEFTSAKPDICILERETVGPAETICQTIKKMRIQDSIAIKDVDNFLSFADDEIKGYKNYIAGINLFEYSDDISDLKNKSFLLLNEQNHVLDIIEKQLKSDTVCLGMYGLQSSLDFMEAYTALSDTNYAIDKLYVSHIISYLIGVKSRVFHFFPITVYENYGSDTEWNRIRTKYATHFVSEELIWSGTMRDDEVIGQLKKISNSGIRLVLTTWRGVAYKNELMHKLAMEDLHVADVVFNCTASPHKIINNKQDLNSSVMYLE